ncbi:hypothetical protein, partial [Streptococcus suis]|uniref:hypothetical protein n=1 Tax=Streptococcus suis TaxID=1307 RepID=UPI0015EF4940
MMTIQKISFVALLIAMFFVAAFSVSTIASAQTTGGGGTGCSGCGCGGTGGNTGGGSIGGGGGGGSTPTPPVCTISLSATTVNIGDRFTLTWNGTPSDATFEINNAPVADSGSAEYIFPSGFSSIRYVMTGANAGGTCT